MKVIKSYSTKVDADLARIRLDEADIPSTIVGIDVAFEGGPFAVRLLVPDQYVDEALKVLDSNPG